jgi:hypothetical protein
MDPAQQQVSAVQKYQIGLAKLSKKIDLLVASCTGGLVPFENNEPAFNPEIGLRRNEQLHFDKKGGE